MKVNTRLLAIIILIVASAMYYAGCNANKKSTEAYASEEIKNDTLAEDYATLQSAYNELQALYGTTLMYLEESQNDIQETMGALNEQWDIVESLRIEIAGYQEDLRTVTAALESGEPLTYNATAYTLRSSWQDLGITRTGYDLNGKDISEHIIAVDPTVIPLNSRAYLKFPEPYRHLDGWYDAKDTGSAIKGLRIDVFFGGRDQASEDAAIQFGRRDVEIIAVIKPE